jgi:hypothetical protein
MAKPVAPSRSTGESAQLDFSEPGTPPSETPESLVTPLLLPLLPPLLEPESGTPPSATSQSTHAYDVEPSGVGCEQVEFTHTPGSSALGPALLQA